MSEREHNPQENAKLMGDRYAASSVALAAIIDKAKELGHRDGGSDTQTVMRMAASAIVDRLRDRRWLATPGLVMPFAAFAAFGGTLLGAMAMHTLLSGPSEITVLFVILSLLLAPFGAAGIAQRVLNRWHR